MSRESIFERVDRMLEIAVKHFKSGKDMGNISPETAEIFERWEYAYRVSKQYYAEGKEYIYSTYATWVYHRFGISNDRTIREDLYAAPILYGKIEPVNREFKRMLAIERLERNIRKAELNQKYAEAARLEAVLFKYLDPALDPVEEKEEDQEAKNFTIMPTFDPKLLGVEPLSMEQVMKFKGEMIKRKKKLLQEIDEADEVKPNTDIEDEQTS